MATDPTPLARCRSTRSAITLIALVLVSALGVAVGSYVALLSFTEQLGNRAFQESRARELAQTGLEEALWALNRNTWTTSGPLSSTSWTSSGTTRTTTLSYPTYGYNTTGQITLTITNATSAGPVWPTINAVAQLTSKDGKVVVTKRLQSSTTTAALFGNAIASAEGVVSFVGGGTVDSWNGDPDNDSATPRIPYSFVAGTPANYAAVVAGKTNSSGDYGVILTQALVNGYAATFGKAVSTSISGIPPGRVKGPTTPASVNVDPTRIGRSAFVPVAPVFGVTMPPTSGPIYGGLLLDVINLVITLLGGIPIGVEVYELNSLQLLTPTLTVDRPLRLIIRGDLNIGTASLGPIILSRGKITITSTGLLELYVLGNVTIAADGIDNQTNDPTKCAIFSTSTSTTNPVVYDSAADFCGVIYAENKPIDIRQSAIFRGALLSRSDVTFSGSAAAPIFHYDSALRNYRFPYISTPYVLRQVTEY